MKSNWLPYLIIFVLSFLVYSNTIGHDYVLDDNIYIGENEKLKEEGISSIPYFFTHYYQAEGGLHYLYRPVTFTTLIVERALFGDSASVAHFFNVLYFSICCCLLFLVLQSVLPQVPKWLLFGAILIYAAHPIHVEAVANIKSRDEILVLIFGLSGLYMLWKYLMGQRLLYLVGAGLFLLLGLLSKENALTFAGVYILCGFFILQGGFRDSIKKLMPVAGVAFGISIVFLIVRMYLSPSIGGEVGMAMQNDLYLANSFTERYATSFLILGRYLRNLFLPIDEHLVYINGVNHIPLTHWLDWRVVISLTAHLIILSYALWQLPKRNLFSFGILFYAITLSVYSNLVMIGGDAMADRFMFIPSVGFCLALVWVLDKLLKVGIEVNLVDFLKANKPFSGLILLFVVIGSVLTIQRNQVWANDYILYAHDMPKLDRCSKAHTFLANEQMSQIVDGKLTATDSLKNEIVQHYYQAIEINPDFALYKVVLGTILSDFGRAAEARKLFEQAYQLAPDHARTNFYAGMLHYQDGLYKLAIPLLAKAIERQSDKPEAYIYAARAMCRQASVKMSDLKMAQQVINEGLRRFPRHTVLQEDLLLVQGLIKQNE